MRLVYVPDELTPFHLVELGEVSTMLAGLLRNEVLQHIEAGRFEAALDSTEKVYTAVWAERDRYAAALAYLYKAEALRRMQRWEEALEHAQRALGWLRIQLTQVADYNQAVASYFEGLIHFVLRADGKALQSFLNAQKILAESERYWGFENHTGRIDDCRNLSRWMSSLLELPSRMPVAEWVMIVPVYELVNQTPMRTDVTFVTPLQLHLPRETLIKHLPSNYIPLEIETLPFLQLHPDARYLALKIPTDGDFARQSRAGDMLLIEAVSSDPSTRAAQLTHNTPFVRGTDGRILFGPYAPGSEGFLGIPRVLIREQEEQE